MSIFAAKPVPCRLVVRIELYANATEIADVMPLLRTEIPIRDYRATEQVRRFEMLAALEAMRRKIEGMD